MYDGIMGEVCRKYECKVQNLPITIPPIAPAACRCLAWKSQSQRL